MNSFNAHDMPRRWPSFSSLSREVTEAQRLAQGPLATKSEELGYNPASLAPESMHSVLHSVRYLPCGWQTFLPVPR